MSETASYSGSYSYSYSYSSSASEKDSNLESSESDSLMWRQIDRIPIDLLHETTDFAYIEKVLVLAASFNFSSDDHRMSDPSWTTKVGRLLHLISTKCSQRISNLSGQIKMEKESYIDEMESLRAKLDLATKQLAALRGNVDESHAKLFETKRSEELLDESETRRLRTENDNLSVELRKITRINNELRQSLQARQEERQLTSGSNEKLNLEYKHLVARYHRLLEKSRKNEDMLEELQKSKDRSKKSEASELERLREQTKKLQKENMNLIESRDRAEELCEKREYEAFRDMTELKRLSKEMVDNERKKMEDAHDQFETLKKDTDAQIEDLHQRYEDDLRSKEEEIEVLRSQLEKTGTHKHFEDNSLDDASSQGSSTDEKGIGARKSSFQRRLQREKDDLSAEVEELELRIDSMEEENLRLNRLIKDYEGGDEGLLRLRNELADHMRTVELLQGENTQLRERLNGMEDSLAFTAALKELCKRMGVTTEEINSLRPNAAAYSEMDTLKEELSVLREEVEWLEKERRHWMNKVRLQPLMDTKLRFELGLTAAQLKQLDELVDQMKEGRLIVEEDDANYKEKYFLELQARRKDAAQFNDYVKERIEDALKFTFKNIDGTDAASAISALKEHIDCITNSSSSSTTYQQLQEQLTSAQNRLDQCELTIKEYEMTAKHLNDRISHLSTEKDAVIKERDQYRDAVFAAVGAASDSLGGDGKSPEDNTFAQTVAAAPKWAAISTTLREQLSVKETVIESLSQQNTELNEHLTAKQSEIDTLLNSVEAERHRQTEMLDQIKSLNDINEELNERNVALAKLNKEYDQSLGRIEDGRTKSLFQKIVLLRRREAKLLQRLRIAISSAEESALAEQKMRHSMESTFRSLREALEGNSTGFVLPPSSSNHKYEEDHLQCLHVSLHSMLQGRLFREDSRYLLHLQQVYNTMENTEEISTLRLREKEQRRQIESLQNELDTVEVKNQAEEGSLSPPKAVESAWGNSSRWESESAVWKQRYELSCKRLEAKDAEIALLEGELDTARHNLLLAKEQVDIILSEEPAGAETDEKETLSMKIVLYEKEVARLKSINLGLMDHSFDLQSTVKSLEVSLESKTQEMTLLKDSSNREALNLFVSAAIEEHAALRRQSELSQIQAKRLRIQLAASEANYQVVANEASAYKLSAYRLYRRYIDETVKVVDYIRSLQRMSKGALTPHRAEIMDVRYRRVLDELHKLHERNASMSGQIADQTSAMKTIEQQLTIIHKGDSSENRDTVQQCLREARADLRDKARQLAEYREDNKHCEAKSRRADAYIRQLNEEIARLEFCVMQVAPLDDDLLANLVHLRDTVFAKADAPPLAIQPIEASVRGAVSSTYGEQDVAVKEYKAAMMKLKETSRECERLRDEVAARTQESQRHIATISNLQQEVDRLEEKASLYLRQLEEERVKMELREARVQKAHATQSDVARRAMEHNSNCLREMISKKDDEIKKLQGQLEVERRKYAEHQLDEAVRMEHLHSKMFYENTAMVERFKDAIECVGSCMTTSSPPGDKNQGGDSATYEQLGFLTSETLRLQKELKSARATIIVLESQLSQQIEQARAFLAPVHNTIHVVTTAPQPPPPTTSAQPLTANPSAAATAAPVTATAIPTNATPTLTPFATAPTGQPTPSAQPASVQSDALTNIIHSQGAMIESLRQREMSLTTELEAEKQRRTSAERELENARLSMIDQQGALSLVSNVAGSVSDSALVQELRSQIAFLDQQVRDSRVALDEERNTTRRLQTDAQEWKKNLDELNLQVSHQQVESQRSQHLVSLNEGLQEDLNAVKEQNDKLLLAASVLKQKLMDEARRGGEASRQSQQEIALAQRMGSIQKESSEHMRVLDHRIKSIQKELNDKLEAESEAAKKQEETQRFVFQLHHQLRSKDSEIAALKSQLEKQRERPQLSSRREQPISRSAKGTQMLPVTTGDTKKPTDTAPPEPAPMLDENTKAQADASHAPQPEPDASPAAGHPPNVIAMISRETQKLQRDNLTQISTLRSRVNRAEKDLEEARDQLEAERNAARSLRVQLRECKKRCEEADARHSSEILELTRQKARAELHMKRTESSASAPTSTPVPNLPQHEELQRLQQRVAELEPLAAAADEYKKQLQDARMLASAKSTIGHSPHISPSVREHVQTVMRLESTIADLSRQLSVDAPARVNEVTAQLTRAYHTIDRLVMELATVKHVSVEEIRTVYGCTDAVTVAGTSIERLEAELLAKSNIILDLRFTQETLQLRLHTLQRHMDEILAADKDARVQSQRSQRNEVEVLEAAVLNLRIVNEKLQQDNKHLLAHSVNAAQHALLVQEVKDLRTREAGLREQLGQLVQRLAGSSSRRAHTPKEADLQQRLVSAQTTAELYHQELDALRRRMEEPRQQPEEGDASSVDRRRVDPLQEETSLPRLADRLPPPLPPSQFPRRRSTASSAASGAQPYNPADYHGGMRHHSTS